MKFLIFTMLILPLVIFAQGGGSISVGDLTVGYESKIENNGAAYYYVSDELVVAEYGDVSLVYEGGVTVLEAHDTDGDGTLDTFLTLDKEGEVIQVTGDGTDELTRPEVVEFEELLAAAPDDLVGDLSSIKIPKYHNYVLYGIIVLLLSGGIWWYRRRK